MSDSEIRLRSAALVALLSLLGCHDEVRAASDADAAPAARRVKARTVNIEIFKTAERVLETAADGSFQYGALTDLGGVTVCVAQRRDAFMNFGAFEPLKKPICTNSVAGETVTLRDVPANSDLILTLRKDGFEPDTLTFRTDEYDVAAPTWAAYTTVPLWRTGSADRWLEPEPAARAANGTVVLWAAADWVGEGTVDDTQEQLATHPLPGATFSEGVKVEVEDAQHRSVASLSTLRERPLWVSLPPALYRFRFSHPRMNMRPEGATIQFMATGFPTDVQDTIEVPVLAGQSEFAVVDVLCAPAWGEGVVLRDLATCTLARAGDAGMP